MGKKAALVGMGCGPYTVTAEGMIAIEKADLICGSKRMLELLPDTGARLMEEYRTSVLSEVIPEASEERIAVLYSGDVSIYSGAMELYRRLDAAGIDTRLIPGVSVVSYFASRIGRSAEDMNVVSCHGRDMELFLELEKGSPLFIYTSNGDDVKKICEKLSNAGKGDCEVMIGERLGYPDERITGYMAKQVRDIEIDVLNILFIESV